MTATMVSVIGIVLSLAFLITLALKGWHIIIIAPLAVCVVSLFSGLNPFTELTGPYMKGFVNYAFKFYLVFLTGSLFGKFIEDSGAAQSIAQGLIKVLGTNSQAKAMWAIAVICMVFTYGGVSLFVALFAIIPIARPVFKQLDIPWHLFVAVQGLGLTAITMTVLPGSPAIQNIIPTKYLGTTPMAGAPIGIIAAIVILIFNFFYIKRQLKKAHKKQEGYALTGGNDTALSKTEFNGDLPPVGICLIPLVVVIVLLNVFSLDVVIALTGGIVTCAVLFWKKYINILKTINQGALNTVIPVINTCADVGYGMAVAATVGFAFISSELVNMGGNPILSLAVGTNLMAAITGSASGGLGIVMEVLAPTYLNLGLSPELVHRIAAIAAGCCDAMPHNGGVITMLALTGLTHAQGYRHIFWAHIVATLCALCIVIPIGIMIYG